MGPVLAHGGGNRGATSRAARVCHALGKAMGARALLQGRRFSGFHRTWLLPCHAATATPAALPPPDDESAQLVLLTTASDGVDGVLKFQQKEVRRVLGTTLIRDAPGRPSVLQACTVEVDASSPETHDQVAL